MTESLSHLIATSFHRHLLAPWRHRVPTSSSRDVIESQPQRAPLYYHRTSSSRHVVEPCDVVEQQRQRASVHVISSRRPAERDVKMTECAGCHKAIVDRYLLKAVDRFWHEGCLKCSCCDGRLDQLGQTLFVKANRLLCRMDYLRYVWSTTVTVRDVIRLSTRSNRYELGFSFGAEVNLTCLNLSSRPGGNESL